MERNLVLENRFYDLGPVVVPRGDNEAYGFKIYEHRPSKNIVIPAQAGMTRESAGMTGMGGVRDL